MSVTFLEIEGSPTFTASKQGLIAKRIGIIDWSAIDAFLVDQLGSSSFVAGAAAVQSSAATFPGKAWLLVDAVEIEPFDPRNPGSPDPLGVSTYTAGAKATITYRTLPYNAQQKQDEDDPDVPQGTYLTHRIGMSLQMQSLPNSALVWASDAAAVPDDLSATLMVPTDEHILSWHFVPRPPWQAMRELRGKINGATFLGSPPGTVLFMGAEASRDYTFEGARSWTVEYHFQNRSIPRPLAGDVAGWNFLYRPDPGAGEEPWQEVVHRDNPDHRLYETGDMTRLLSYG